MATRTEQEWTERAHSLGKTFAERASSRDGGDAFVHENYAELKEEGFTAALIPAECGGGGVTHALMCEILRILGSYCGSTALALSMHQHLLAAAVWRLRHGQGGEAMLRNVAEKRLILVSTGAQDWLASSGIAERSDGGYAVTATKHFASQSAAGDLLVTSAPYHDPVDGPQVIHFAVPFGSAGLRVLDNWRAMGMRGTGSHTVSLERVQVPEAAVSLRRPAGVYHPVWNVIITVAMPLITSVYLGIAERAAALAIDLARTQKERKGHLPLMVGAMQNELVSAQLHVADMVRLANDFAFEPQDRLGQAGMARKVNASNACIGVVTKAMEIAGGRGYLRDNGMEKLFRDVQAARYHLMQEHDQLLFSGEYHLRG